MIVKIENSSTEVDFSDPEIKKLIVKIGNKFYKRTDRTIVKIGNRFFRRNSKLISKDFNGTYCLVKDLIEVLINNASNRVDKVMVSALSPYIVTANCGNKTLSDYSIRIDKKYYLYSDPAIVLDSLSSSYILKSDAVVVQKEGINFSWKENEDIICHKLSGKIFMCEYDSKFYLKNLLVTVSIFDGKNKKKLAVCSLNKSKLMDKLNLKEVYLLNHLRTFYDFHITKVLYNPKENNSLIFSRLLGAYVLTPDLEILENTYNKLNLDAIKSTDKNKLSSRLKEFKEYGFDPGNHYQNTPEIYSEIRGRVSGGEFSYKSENRDIERSISLRGTGGIGYTFGVEFETADGALNPFIANKLGLHIMTDGSLYHEEIGNQGFEYVTKPLHGSKGVAHLKKVCEELRRSTINSTKCSTHIHVGGATFRDGVESDKPIFSREFSARTLSLGVQVEDELFSLLPDYRNPKKNRYCASIKRFKNIIPLKKKVAKEIFLGNKKKYNDYLSSVKSGMRTLDKSIKKPSKTDNMFNGTLAEMIFGTNKLDRNNNSNSQLTRWANSRYYWLNLVNCNTDNSGHRSREGGFKTIEFRAFPPSHNNDDILFYLLFSLSFVWFCENRPSMILKGDVNLELMFKEAINDKKSSEFIKGYLHNKQTNK